MWEKLLSNKKVFEWSMVSMVKGNSPVVEIVTLYGSQLEDLAYHIFSFNLNYTQFHYVSYNRKK